MPMTSWNDLPLMLSAQQTAEVTGYGVFRIRELCAAGKMPHVRLGRAYKIPRDTLRAWLERQAEDAVQ